jgi:hypothetical protein
LGGLAGGEFISALGCPDQGLSRRGRQGHGEYGGFLLGAGGQQPRRLWPLGLAEFKESVYAIAANFDALVERAVAGRSA